MADAIQCSGTPAAPSCEDAAHTVVLIGKRFRGAACRSCVLALVEEAVTRGHSYQLEAVASLPPKTLDQLRTMADQVRQTGYPRLGDGPLAKYAPRDHRAKAP